VCLVGKKFVVSKSGLVVFAHELTWKFFNIVERI